tara:strand:+ start:108 stop:242 length:135 start_codon:yes stop_codon:yes gene_type:complete
MSQNWVLSSRSREKLSGVNPELAGTVERAAFGSPFVFLALAYKE